MRSRKKMTKEEKKKKNEERNKGEITKEKRRIL
jgi:hypothetical protein